MKTPHFPFQIIILAFVYFFCAPLISQTQSDPAKAIPHSIDGWNLSIERNFNDSTLYDYIDGGAELFLSFGFTNVKSMIFQKEDEPDIIVDLFYMNTSSDAFGVFSFSVGEIGNDLGKQSQIAQGAVIFWKSNFYISITYHPETDECKTTALKIAKILDNAITERGNFPEIINFLPTTKLDKESIRYFRHYIWLNSHGFISSENILNIDQNTEAVLAKYGKETKTILLIVKYPSETEAQKAKEHFVKYYVPDLKGKETTISIEGKWCGIDVKKNFFLGVFDCSNKESIKTLIDQTKERIK